MPRLLPTGFVTPCQPTPVQVPPAALDWLHEVKHDGYGGRLMARVRTRRGYDWTKGPQRRGHFRL